MNAKRNVKWLIGIVLALCALLLAVSFLRLAAIKRLLRRMDASNADRTVEKLVLLRADSEARTEFGETALLLACRLGARESSVELLLRRGADVNVREIDEGYTPLHHASYWGNVAVVRCLLSHGAKPDVKENVDKETPFDWARSGRARLGTNEVRRQQYETILGLLLEISQSKAGE